ncbi:MAG: hypothetical protein F4148_17355 [Caldilineaceae bacterium SB0675_bin_29]|uniref:Uncharacterized protein n=1 Tax=Caldilineaceae bacterium SB0675_bin_29 TaxID=2605266 RepID=A0A6B1GBH0_9CHLR|nr:hypothetical protein [Caldilineaceae bacterium SB0675_bin_29]
MGCPSCPVHKNTPGMQPVLFTFTSS